MPLTSLIKLLIISTLISGNSFALTADSTSRYKVNSRYHKENNPWFQFGVFKRGFSNRNLVQKLDSLENTPRRNWSRLDSLTFASSSLKTGNIALSEYYFDALKIDYSKEKQFWFDHLMIHLINGEYHSGLKLIRYTTPGIVEFSKLYFFEKIFEASINCTDEPKWIKSNLVLNWEVDSTLFGLDKNSEEFKQQIIKPLKNLEFVIELIVHYFHEDYPVLATVCFEMGQILEHHVSYTQAYIAYSLGRHYNKRDKELLSEIKKIKAKLIERNYKIPIFRKNFPRIEYWRFDYEVLKEKVISQMNDTLDKIRPDIIQPKKKKEIVSFPLDYIIIAGIGLMILLVLIFLKTKAKK